jgi:hypothetical protein
VTHPRTLPEGEQDLGATERSLAVESLRDAIYDVLVRECGAHDSETDRLQWAVFWKNGPPNEYRFIGKLGFGGKVWISRSEPPHVSCYREDETPERLAMIATANAALTELQTDRGPQGSLQ